MPHNQIYFDANSSIPLNNSAKESLLASLELRGNPSSIHLSGRLVRSQIEESRKIISDFLQVSPAQVIFTSGGTEANNLALTSFDSNQILASSIEHDCVLNLVNRDTHLIPVTQKGVVDLNQLDQLLASMPHIKCVSVMHANNETGIIQPVREISGLCKKHNVFLHTDAVQSFSKIPLTFEELGVDSLALSAHKVGGLQGVGALVVSESFPLSPLITGGGQERRRRGGTENVPGIISFGAALKDETHNWHSIESLRNHMEKSIALMCPQAQVIAEDVSRLPNTTILRMPGVDHQTQVLQFDLRKISISAGSACSSGKVEPSHVLKAMGIETNDCIRVSLPPTATLEEVETFIQAWKEIFAQNKKDSK